jgi:short-subunit dehydrogenase involved in D-alanine esterification of teichoic acids
MHAEDFLINDSCDRQAVEAISESFPQLNIISSLAFIIEAIDSIDARALMIPAQQEEILGVFDFVC